MINVNISALPLDAAYIVNVIPSSSAILSCPFNFVEASKTALNSNYSPPLKNSLVNFIGNVHDAADE
jgi:hypothetical protein